jgi:protein-tyrosine-phosphatase
MTDDNPAGSFLVLFICTGNTCRSPMAEGLLKKLLADRSGPPTSIDVASAGTMGLVGMPATDFAVEVSASYGVDIHQHHSQAATPELLDRADLVLALAADHYDFCRDMKVPPERLYMLRAFPGHPNALSQYVIPDPIGSPREQYQRTFFLIEEALRRCLPDIFARAADSRGGAESTGE